MQIHESFLLEERMDGIGHCVPYPEDCSERVGPESHVCDCPEIFEGGVLLLERISHRVTFTVQFDFLCLDLDTLAAAD